MTHSCVSILSNTEYQRCRILCNGYNTALRSIPSSRHPCNFFLPFFYGWTFDRQHHVKFYLGVLRPTPDLADAVSFIIMRSPVTSPICFISTSEAVNIYQSPAL